jgi:putative flippase GtrA
MKVWYKQFFRYGVVGVASTTVHVVMAFFLLNYVGLTLLSSNVGAFFTAIFVSYFGNAIWSFEAGGEVRSMAKFFVASAVTLTLIVLISNGVTEAELPPYTGILMIAVVIPIVGFILQKLWVFNR